jgi:hypothetical protein
MPSTVVHVALALLLAAGLLGRDFDRRAVAVVAAVTAFPDLDVFTALVVEATHRAAFHTLLLPGALALALWVDERCGGRLRARYGGHGVRVAWVALFGYVVAGIGLDLFTSGGANPLYPLYDQFVEIDGAVGYTTAEGFYQTFVDVRSESPTADGGGGGRSVDVGQRGSTEEVHVASGVDPQRGPEPADVERVFPVVYRGWQVTLVLAGVVATWGRLRLGGRESQAPRERTDGS